MPATTPAEQPVSRQTELDKKDYEILRLLQENAKLTVRDIASKVNLSPTPVHERIKRLEANGVIKQYAALLDNRQVKKSIMVICYVSLKDHSRRAGEIFIQAVMGFDEVIECYNISGEFDFMLKVVAESMESYHHFYVNHLSEIIGISHLQSIFVMDTIKSTHQLI